MHKSTKGRIRKLEDMLKARRGNKAYKENCLAIERELERLKNASTD